MRRPTEQVQKPAERSPGQEPSCSGVAFTDGSKALSPALLKSRRTPRRMECTPGTNTYAISIMCVFVGLCAFIYGPTGLGRLSFPL